MNTYTVYEDVADLGFPVEANSFKDAALLPKEMG